MENDWKPAGCQMCQDWVWFVSPDYRPALAL